MKKLTLILALIGLFTMCKPKQPADSITFSKTNLYPEGVEFDETSNSFLVTSLKEGMVGKVGTDGKYTPFIQDENLISAIGIRIDRTNNRIYVCSSDPGASVKTKPETQGKLAGLGVYELKTGKKIAYLDLGSLTETGNFANDIALDDKGNVYVSNSFGPSIFKVTKDLKAEVFLENERFKGEGFGLNGLVYDPSGFLIVAKYNEGVFFKIPVSNPSQFTEIKLDSKIVGADGLLWGENGKLIVIANAGTNKVFELSSSDGWDSAKIESEVAAGEVFPTTGIKVGKNYFYLHSMLNKLFDPKNTVPTEQFIIKKLDFK